MDDCDYSPIRPQRLYVAAVLLLLFFAGGCGQDTQTSEEQGPRKIPVRTAEVRADDFRETVSGIGSLQSPEIVEIKPEISALIEAIHAREGTEVARGDVLYTLDADTIESELSSTRAALQSAEAELENASATHDRFRRLFERRTISQEEYEERYTALLTADAEVERLKGQVRLMKERLEDSTIRAPMDGVLAEHQVDPGAYAEAGDTLITLYTVDPLEISFRIPEGYMDRVEPGQQVIVQLPAGNIPEHQGEVSFVSPSIDPATRKFLVKAVVDNSDGTLKPGAFASAQVVVDVREKRPAVPERALVSRRTGYAVFVVENGRAARRQVEIGLRRPGVVEILSGVEIGESVVTAGQMRLEDGVDVHVEEGDSHGNATGADGAEMNTPGDTDS